MLVYWQHKLKTNGICSNKVFHEGLRKMHRNSLDNLQKGYRGKSACNDYVELLSVEYQEEMRASKGMCISQSVSKKIAATCRNLEYFSNSRKFISSKKGTFSMKIAFITLTAPSGFDVAAMESAFSKFKEYLHRTANCEYVYKKELGTNSSNLHYHIIVNNFIPFYIVNWKWSKLLTYENNMCENPINIENLKASTRIELPRSKKAVNHYIAKYMSKSQIFTFKVGALWGCSENLKHIEFPSMIENDISSEEFDYLYKKFKVITKDYMCFVCCDCLSLAKACPNVYAVFRPFFDEMRELLTHEQRFHYVDSSQKN